MKNGLLVVGGLGVAAWLLLRGGGGKTGSGMNQVQTAFDTTPQIPFEDAPAAYQQPDISKQTSSPASSLGTVIQTAQQVQQAVNIAKAVPAVLSAVGLTEAPAVSAAAVQAAIAAPAAAPAGAASVAAVEGIGVGGVLAGAALVLAPIAAVIGAFELFASDMSEYNRPENLAKLNAETQAAEMEKYSIWGSGSGLAGGVGTRFKPGNA